MKLVIEVPEEISERLINAVTNHLGYEDQLIAPNQADDKDRIENPESRVEFLENWLIGFLEDTALKHEQSQAVETASHAAQDAAIKLERKGKAK